jgi:dTDP-4-dehydrorhamnose reductase
LRTILLFGRTGQVGQQLLGRLRVIGEVVSPSRAEADLAQPETVRSLLLRVKPHVIVNAAAYTAVDAAEREPALAHRINADAPSIMARCARDLDAVLLHYSTDYVFDGARGPYVETDTVNPLNAYGRSKLAGEVAIRESGALHLILRTSWVYGATGKNFLNTVIRLADERPLLRIVDDQRGAPTWSRTIAEVSTTILRQLQAGRPSQETVGTYHLTNTGDTTWFGFAKLIVDESRPLRRGSPRVEPIRSEEYPTPARRPADSRLDCRKLTETFGVTLPHWRDAALRCLAEIRSEWEQRA